MRSIARSPGSTRNVATRAEADGRAVRQRDRQRGQILDRLSIRRTEQQAHRHFALGGAQLAQPIAAHGGRDGGCDRLRRQVQLRRAVAIDDDVNLLVAAARLGVHAFQAGDRGELSRHLERQVVEPLGRVARQLQAEALARSLLVELEARLADEDLRHLVGDPLHHVLRAHAGRVLRRQLQQASAR